MPCCLVEVKHHFRGINCLLLPGQRVSQIRRQHEAGNKMLHLLPTSWWFLAWHTLQPWTWR
jgi:hypothetical protein